MASAPAIATTFASTSASVDIPKHGMASTGLTALITPPNSVSPDLPAHHVNIDRNMSPPPMDMIEEAEQEHSIPTTATPLSKGALSGLDAAAAITPAMLAKHHLPGIMLGNGPRPIRYVMGELTQSVPGFSRIPPAKARRLVVAALENRHGGGPDGNVTFCKTGWGRWDAHIKGSSKDSGVGSFGEGHMSPPRSERSSYAYSNGDSGVHMRGARLPSWTASSLREEDELEMDMDMDVPENDADKMSMDGDSSMHDDETSSGSDTDLEDWTAAGPVALRKASLPIPGAPRINYNAKSMQSHRPPRSWSRRPSGFSQRSVHSSSLPQRSSLSTSGPSRRELDPSLATPEEKAAVAALLSLGKSM